TLREGEFPVRDLNGDGDTLDVVVMVYDASTDTLTNLGLASQLFAADDQFVAVPVSEAEQGNTDLDGDGNTYSDVIHVYDLVTQQTTNLGRVYYSGDVLSVFGGHAVFLTYERGADLNGDGDLHDSVATIYDHATGAITTLPLARSGNVTYPYGSGNLVFVPVGEYDQGHADRNGDGGAFDVVP